MNKISLLLVVCILPLFCSASDEVNIEYITSSMYSGNIGRNNITMNIVSSRNAVSGSYIYNQYKSNILLSGVISFKSIELKERQRIVLLLYRFSVLIKVIQATGAIRNVSL